MIAAVLSDPARLRLSVRVQPRAARNHLAGVHGGALKIQLTAPPVDGAANAALIGFLAETLELPRSAVRIVSGEHARTKVVDITAENPAVLQQRLGL